MNYANIANNDPCIKAACYLSNNRYAYYADISDEKMRCTEVKVYNFVPTYDKWCLYCNNHNAKMRCTRCKTIYFCNIECQKRAWSVHKKHCGRDQFILCCYCGVINKNVPSVKCDKCPVRYCSQECYNKLHTAHKDFDCDTFCALFK